MATLEPHNPTVILPAPVPNYKAIAMVFAMAHQEGYDNVKSIAFKQCNPGNLRSWSRDVPVVNGYAQFPIRVAGFKALYDDILANSGKLTLRQFIAKYAPSGDKDNAPSIYAQNVSLYTGIGLDELF